MEEVDQRGQVLDTKIDEQTRVVDIIKNKRTSISNLLDKTKDDQIRSDKGSEVRIKVIKNTENTQTANVKVKNEINDDINQKSGSPPTISVNDMVSAPAHVITIERETSTMNNINHGKVVNSVSQYQNLLNKTLNGVENTVHKAPEESKSGISQLINISGNTSHNTSQITPIVKKINASRPHTPDTTSQNHVENKFRSDEFSVMIPLMKNKPVSTSPKQPVHVENTPIVETDVNAKTTEYLQHMYSCQEVPCASLNIIKEQELLNSIRVIPPKEREKIQAAPFPDIPPSYVIREEIVCIDEEINKLKNYLDILYFQHELGSLALPRIEDSPKSSNIQNFKGFYIGHNLVNKIIADNMEKVNKSHNVHILHNIEHKIGNISQLPHITAQLDEIDLEPIFRIVHNDKFLRKNLNENLASEYASRHEIWQNHSKYLDVYHSEIHESVDRWPNEYFPSKRNDREISELTAPDVSMLLTDMENEFFYDENMLVVNPVAEHNQYKGRIKWSDHEIAIFLEKYAQHKKDFKKISQASGLQNKTEKDVIEFYYLKRRHLNLKELENKTKKRGRKRVTEGNP